MTLDEQRLFPYTTAPRRIAEELIGVLRAVEGVTAISLFGSLATGTEDGFSDVDMIVEVARADVAWVCAEAIRRSKPVLHYGQFTDTEQPAGRYWFEGESLYHQLDVSFLDTDGYARARAEGVRPGFPIKAREVFRRESCAPAHGAEQATPLPISERERIATSGAYSLLKATKEYLRARIDQDEYAEAYRSFLERTRGATPGTRFAGGRLAELVQECFELKMAVDRWASGG